MVTAALARSTAAQHWLQWSPDEGRTWLALATDVDGDVVKLPPGVVPMGVVHVRVLVHDGFHTTASEPVRVEVPDRAPEVAVLHPREGQEVDGEDPLRLQVTATAPTH